MRTTSLRSAFPRTGDISSPAPPTGQFASGALRSSSKAKRSGAAGREFDIADNGQLRVKRIHPAGPLFHKGMHKATCSWNSAGLRVPEAAQPSRSREALPRGKGAPGDPQGPGEAALGDRGRVWLPPRRGPAPAVRPHPRLAAVGHALRQQRRSMGLLDSGGLLRRLGERAHPVRLASEPPQSRNPPRLLSRRPVSQDPGAARSDGAAPADGSLDEALRQAQVAPKVELQNTVPDRIAQTPKVDILSPDTDAQVQGDVARVQARVQSPPRSRSPKRSR